MIYVASSWRNPYYENVVKRLKKEGFPVYDFRNPPHGGKGFHWTDVDENAGQGGKPCVLSIDFL